jgi:putative membrane protein
MCETSPRLARGSDEEPIGEVDVRFSLANERTLLAWGRTALAIIATGLILGKVLPPGVYGRLQTAAGMALAIAGTVLASWAYRDYRRTDHAIRRGEPVARSGLPAALLFTIVVSGVVALLLMR